MHLPDGYLDAKTSVAAAVAAAVAIGIALRPLARPDAGRRAPLTALAAAFIFAAQMVNFPISGGTSGHLVGGALAAVLLGPAAAVAALSAVVILQCFVFVDGGVLALGANLFNMAVLAPVGGYAVYRLLTRPGSGTGVRVAAAAAAAWASVVLSAMSCAGQLVLSGTVAAWVALPAMAHLHMLIGLGEAAITALIVRAVLLARPDLIEPAPATSGAAGTRSFVAVGLVAAFGLAAFASPFASASPDGLERTAENLGFASRAAGLQRPAPLPDYAFPGLDSPLLGTALAGLIGTLLVFALTWGVARLPGWFDRRRARAIVHT